MSKILIVDDDDIFRTMMAEMVRHEGYEIEAVGNGQEALAYIERDRPLLIITDILMPEMDGIEFIMKLNEGNNAIPIIAVSGGRRSISLEFNLESAALMGVQTTLPKPFTREALRAAINTALEH